MPSSSRSVRIGHARAGPGGRNSEARRFGRASFAAPLRKYRMAIKLLNRIAALGSAIISTARSGNLQRVNIAFFIPRQTISEVLTRHRHARICGMITHELDQRQRVAIFLRLGIEVSLIEPILERR